MERIDTDVLAAAAVTVLCVATGIPVLLVQLAGDDLTRGPVWLWWTAFAGYVATMACCMWLVDSWPRRRLLVSFAGLTVFGPVLVLLAPAAGWTPILLVFTAALSAYHVDRRVTAAVVAGNVLVVASAGLLHGNSAFEIGMTAFLYLLLQLVSVLGIVSEQRDQRSRRELAEAHTQLRATTALLADSSRATERLRIARDLHDVVGHQVTALALELEVASHHSVPPASEHVTRARQIAKDLLSDMRRTVGHLREQTPELHTALAAVVEGLPAPDVHLEVADGLRVDDARRTALVRCVQEIVTNAIRHSEARNLWIEVGTDDAGNTVLSARDDGRGAQDLVPGNGLTGMRERVEHLGGQARFSTNGGFHVVASLPTAP